jgi:hypothetical protein
MNERVPQSSGGTIHAAHIEAPTKLFGVQWFSPAYDNVLRFAPTIRTQTVLAETPEGALAIAKYHHYRGTDFKLVELDDRD